MNLFWCWHHLDCDLIKKDKWIFIHQPLATSNPKGKPDKQISKFVLSWLRIYRVRAVLGFESLPKIKTKYLIKSIIKNLFIFNYFEIKMLPVKLFPMVLILYGNWGNDAHVRSNLYYLICLRHLIRSRAVTNRIFPPPKRPIFLHACARSPVLSYHLT